MWSRQLLRVIWKFLDSKRKFTSMRDTSARSLLLKMYPKNHNLDPCLFWCPHLNWTLKMAKYKWKTSFRRWKDKWNIPENSSRNKWNRNLVTNYLEEMTTMIGNKTSQCQDQGITTCGRMPKASSGVVIMIYGSRKNSLAQETMTLDSLKTTKVKMNKIHPLRSRSQSTIDADMVREDAEVHTKKWKWLLKLWCPISFKSCLTSRALKFYKLKTTASKKEKESHSTSASSTTMMTSTRLKPGLDQEEKNWWSKLWKRLRLKLRLNHSSTRARNWLQTHSEKWSMRILNKEWSHQSISTSSRKLPGKSQPSYLEDMRIMLTWVCLKNQKTLKARTSHCFWAAQATPTTLCTSRKIESSRMSSLKSRTFRMRRLRFRKRHSPKKRLLKTLFKEF